MASDKKPVGAISIQAFRRLPVYYNHLMALSRAGETHVSAPAVARALGLNEVQVRKDLAAVSVCGGRPRTGFEVAELLASIAGYLGYNNIDDAVLVGVGQLGRALLAHKGFEENGVRIVAAFDADPALAGRQVAGKKVFPMEKLPALCGRLGAHIGVLAVPAEAAQTVAEAMVQSGILAIWNFAPAHLVVPPKVLVQNENLAASLALLAHNMENRTPPSEGGGE